MENKTTEDYQSGPSKKKTKNTQKKTRIRLTTDRAWFSHLLQNRRDSASWP